MIFISRIGIILSILLLCLLGSITIGIGLHMFDINLILSYIEAPENKVMFIQLGVLIWIVALIIIYSSYVLSQEEKELLFRNAYGDVRVTKKAIEDFVNRMCIQEPNIRRSKPKIVIKKKYVRVSLNVALTSDIPISQATSELQVKVKESLETGIGISNVKMVTIKVDEIIYTGGRLRGKEYSSEGQ
jgi:uncharacterized alkaline shock family protein YloU